jgi:ligand-binding SRPBCC domain-containing protein
MKEYQLEREQWIPASLPEVFGFFAEAANLEIITPPWLGFRIRTPPPIEMATDRRIDYTLRLAGAPVRWRTRIRCWEPPFRFVDVQERGPYALWEHTHLFREIGAGVLMTDVVRYGLPMGPLGALAHALAVRASLASIFDYRFRRVREIFAREIFAREVFAQAETETAAADGSP